MQKQDQQTSLDIQEIMTDTAGASEIIFALFWLLGYQFSPRLADVGGARFWRIDSKADYGVLINFLGHFSFMLPKVVSEGQLRPLNVAEKLELA